MITLGKALVFFIFSILLLSINSMYIAVADNGTPQPTVTPTEADGGMIGVPIDELHCPNNLTGEGPSWNGITIGISSLEEVSQQFELVEALVVRDPFFIGDYAPNYQFRTNAYGDFYVCVVNGTVAALLVARNSVLPANLAQWISFLGEPELVSWHVFRPRRLLHWPQHGVSVTFELYTEQISSEALAEWVYMYPFRDDNFDDMWPINNVILEQPYPTPIPEIELESLDFDAVQLTLTSEPSWATATPRAIQEDFHTPVQSTASP